MADIAQAQVRAGGEIPANRRDSVMKCCWMHELGLTANVLTHLEDGVESSIPANGHASAKMRVRYVRTIVMRRAARAVGGTRQGRTECRPAMPMETDRDAYQVAFKIALSAGITE